MGMLERLVAASTLLKPQVDFVQLAAALQPAAITTPTLEQLAALARIMRGE